MRNVYLFFIVVIFSLTINSQELSLMTYNIRLDVASDGENSWSHRKEFLVSQLQFYKPDIFGIQEGMPHQVEFINNKLQSYQFIGEGRNGGNKGEFSAIFFNKQKYKVINKRTFWLSETPTEMSKGWDAAFPRVCTYGMFEDKITGKKFWVFNTHLDHIGEQARLESVKLILKKIQELNIANFPVFFMGDLNATPNSKPILIVENQMNASKKISKAILIGSNGTFNGFKYNEISTYRIDYIFTSKSVEVLNYAVLNNSNNLTYPSDHFPVYIEVKLN